MEMLTVSAVEFQRNLGRYQDEALKQPRRSPRNGRERLVVLAVEEYQRLKHRDRVVSKTEELTETEITAITKGGMDARRNRLNAELE